MIQKLIFFICIGFPFLLSAQDGPPQRFKAGITAGLNASQINGDQSAGFEKLGLVAGIRGVTVINEKMELSLEILFSQRGSRSDLFNSNNTNIPFNIELNYIEVPVLFNFGDWLSNDEEYYRLHFHAGFSYGNLFSTNIEDDGTGILTADAEFYRTNNVSWLGGFTYFINKHLGATVRYSRSITPLFEPENPAPNQRSLIGHFFTIRALFMFN